MFKAQIGEICTGLQEYALMQTKIIIKWQNYLYN